MLEHNLLDEIDKIGSNLIKQKNKKIFKMEATNKLTVKADGYDKNPSVELIAKDSQAFQIESAGKSLVITQKGNARGVYPFKVIIKSERSDTGMMELDLDSGRITYTDMNGVVKNVKWE